ncbi:Beta-galactosidase, beta-sandwich domain, partial [Dillenia turbinata]
MTGGCAALLINKNATTNATIQFQNNTYTLLPKSISILLDCQNVTFNTRKVTAKYNKRISRSSQELGAAQDWEEFKDVIPNFNDTSLLANMLLEHMNTTKDQSDHLWYTS